MTEVIKKQESLPTEYVRFDRNYAHNGIDFDRQFGNEGQLIFDIFLYISFTYQNNLFGYNHFEPKEFAKKMGYRLPNLLDSHPEPKQMINDKRKKNEFVKLSSHNLNDVRISGDPIESFFYTKLDNAFYVALTENIVFEKKYKDEDGGNVIMKSIQLFKGIEKIYKKNATGGIPSVSYNYIINEEFVNNITRFFLPIDITSVNKLRQKNSAYLYAYLKNLQVSLFNAPGGPHLHSDSLNFDMLCSIAQLDLKNPSDAKKRLKQKIKQIFQLTDLKGEFKYIRRPKDKFNFQPWIKFEHNPALFSLDAKHDTINKAILTRFKHNLRNAFIAKERVLPEINSLKAWVKALHHSELHLSEGTRALVLYYKEAWEHVQSQQMKDNYLAVTGVGTFIKRLN